MHKVKSGAVDKSYGIHVARLANMPDKLLKRAEEILENYENGAKKKYQEEKVQLSMDFSEPKLQNDELKKQIENLDVMNMTPLVALNYLFELKEKIKKGEQL